MNRIVKYFMNNRNPSSLLKLSLSKFTSDTFIHPRRKVMPLPSNMQLEPTTCCNFNCVYCCRRSLSHQRTNISIAYENVVKLLDENPRVKSIRLQGLGEPLLTANLRQIVEEIKSRGISVSTATNGSLLGSNRYIDLALEFDALIVSFDTGDAHTFQSTRRNSNFHSIVGGIKKLVQRRNSLCKQPKIFLNTVISHLNYQQIPSLYDIAVKLGIDGIGMTQVWNLYVPKEREYPEMYAFALKTRKLTNTINRLAKELGSRLSEKGISLGFRPHQDSYETTCRWGFDSAYVTCDGFLTSCCVRMNPDVYNLGNVFQDKFSTVWNSRKYQMFRASMMKALPNGVCDGCPTGIVPPGRSEMKP